MKKLILLLLFIPLVSCKDSKKVKNPASLKTNFVETKTYNSISKEDLDRLKFRYDVLVNQYRNNATDTGCISTLSGLKSYYEPNERTIFMGNYFNKGNWNYIDKTFNVDNEPMFVAKKHSIRFDENIFIYLYSDIYCAILDKKYDVAKPLISLALNIYSSNISTYYNVNDLKFINDYTERISNFSNLIPE